MSGSAGSLLDPGSTSVDRLMATGVIAVQQSASIRDAMRLMEQAGVTGLPVVDGEGAPVGVVSLRDMMAADGGVCATCAADAREHYFGKLALDGSWTAGPDGLHDPAGQVSTLMSRTLRSCDRATSVAEAAQRMANEGVHRLLVVDDGKLVGVLSAIDVVAYVGGA
jgi:CBS domain-containing protein